MGQIAYQRIDIEEQVKDMHMQYLLGNTRALILVIGKKCKCLKIFNNSRVYQKSIPIAKLPIS